MIAKIPLAALVLNCLSAKKKIMSKTMRVAQTQ